MDATAPLSERFATEIQALILATETCLSRAGDDREAALQREAFRERCDRAVALAQQLAGASPEEASRLDGDAWRARESLALSLDFFRRRTGAKQDQDGRAGFLSRLKPLLPELSPEHRTLRGFTRG
jgi:hypothetical protein